jgi:hypothetical protein
VRRSIEGTVGRTGERRGRDRILVGKMEKRTLGRPRRRRHNAIKI